MEIESSAQTCDQIDPSQVRRRCFIEMISDVSISSSRIPSFLYRERPKAKVKMPQLLEELVFSEKLKSLSPGCSPQWR